MAFQEWSTVGTEQYSPSDVWIYPTSVKPPGQFQKMLKLSVKLIQWLRHADVRDVLSARTLQSDLIPFRKVGIGPEMKTYCDRQTLSFYRSREKVFFFMVSEPVFCCRMSKYPVWMKIFLLLGSLVLTWHVIVTCLVMESLIRIVFSSADSFCSFFIMCGVSHMCKQLIVWTCSHDFSGRQSLN